MLRTVIVLIVLLFGTAAHAQQMPDALVREFNKSLDKNYTEKDLSMLFRVLDSLQVYTYDIESGLDSIDVGEDSVIFVTRDERMSVSIPKKIPRKEVYYMPDFKKSILYTANIKKLLSSPNQYQRAVAYRLIGETSDTSFATLVTINMSSEKEEYPCAWIVMAVAKTAPKQTSALFDFIMKHEDFEDAHMLPYLMTMDTASLIATGYEKLYDTTPIAKAVALQLVAQFDRSAKAKEAILNAIATWPVKTIKVYAIAALAMYQNHHLKQYFAPYAFTKDLKEVVGQILLQSETPEDVAYGKELLGEKE